MLITRAILVPYNLNRRLFSSTTLAFNKTLIQFENANIHRFGNLKPAFKDLSWTLKDGERWVVVGAVSAGKTTFAEVGESQYFVVHAVESTITLSLLSGRPWRVNI
jgi:ABC-type molybdenum transport system ATPase subunit/photorepair protein PhrA